MSIIHVLVIGYVWPEPRSSAAGTRMMQLIELFLEQGWRVTFASPAARGEHRENLEAIGIAEHNIELNSGSFDDYITQLRPDMVLFDRFMMEEQFGWRVEKHCPGALRVLDTEDLHSLREARLLALKQILKDAPDAPDLQSLFAASHHQLFQWMAPLELTQREIASIYRSDLSLMISDFEMDLLREQFGVPPDLLHHCPLMQQADSQALLGFEEREHFISIGNFRHGPNWDAVLWLKQSIWPLIRRRLPRAELHVYGAYPPPKATDLHNPRQGFWVKGWADDALAVMKAARVCLAPLRFGAGIKGKLVDAMLCGTPSVTTPFGEEAMAGALPWGGGLACSAEEFAEVAARLYQDPILWRQAQADGQAILQRRFDKAGLARALLEKLDGFLGNLEQHRLANFTGAMLRHHQHRSTHYMAKWIEAKNRLR